MAIRIALNHRTYYRYDRRVTMTPHVIRLRPAVHSRTPILAYSLKVKPEPHFLNWQQDVFGNFLARVSFPEPTDHFSFEVDLIADLEVYNPFDFFVEDEAEHFPFTYSESAQKELGPYLQTQEKGPHLEKFLKGLDLSKTKIVDFLVYVNRAVEKEVNYSVRMEPGVQTCEETLKRKVGSCRDSAYLLVQVFRHLGLAARFCSGYLVQLAADQEALDGPSGTAEDFTDLHAWTEVYVPGAGWIGLDPTSGLLTGEGHIPLACTPEPESAAPVTGSLSECETLDFEFSNTVKRIHEDPRVTKPYSDAQWKKIDALGEKVESSLRSNDVRLSMGGEPTFISLDNREGPEWDTEADSPQKRQLAYDLLKRLLKIYAPGGIHSQTEGKWYPGEPLPRWSYEILWRKDHQPIWKNQDLLASPVGQGHLTQSDVLRFAKRLTQALHLDPDCLLPAYEDKYYFLWKEGQLPVSAKSEEADLKSPLERQYLANALSRGLDAVVGRVLPLKWDYARGDWTTVAWKFRRKKLFLTPGGSALGLRLPLATLSETFDEPSHEEVVLPRSPLEPAPELPQRTDRFKYRLQTNSAPPQNRLRVAPSRVISAITFELRDGQLVIFLPPLDDATHHLDLLAAIETVAEDLNIAVLLEGYAAPYDIRTERLKITPDPGVIEVNVHPSGSWSDLKNLTLELYEQARLARLATEKFMVDGRHTGTGGGNHVTLGGFTPADSPFLRRPHLLRSFLTYWQRHPGLSYLFSGTFIGPTSQAPRLDEGRGDRLYELEIAFQQLPPETQSPWVVDRVLRNFLTDLTGNTHRAEFCIDKLYSPDSASGRLGILELRAFEMPPHAQMSLLQMLMIRAFVATFWEKPYHGKLVRWDTELHDRFLLPYYVQEDLRDVCRDLKDRGFNFEFEWLDPYFEFRFPVYGRVQYDDITLEIRMALEPWTVLGEESASTGVSRYVDSSVERVQLRVTGLTKDRHIVTCNGRTVPLSPTGTKGEFVAGVRYKAWQPWSAMHPTIEAQSTLVFDIIDTWNERSIGGCQYHVSHPGGLSYDTPPINSYEAESRRASRFDQIGHTPSFQEEEPKAEVTHQPRVNGRSLTSTGKSEEKVTVLPKPETNPDFPHTLDLRRESF